MNNKYIKLNESIDNKDDGDSDFIRKDSDQNVDQLIVKPHLVSYVDKRFNFDVEKNGLMSPYILMARYPKYKKKIMDVYGDIINNPVLSKSVFAFFCRIPTILPNTKQFTNNNSPIKIIVEKLNKSNNNYKILLVNHPKYPDKLINITSDKLLKLTQNEKLFFDKFKNSKNNLFLDAPHAAIYSEDGIVPSFACKILKDS